MPKDVIITPASGLIDFQGNTGISSATIQLDNNGNLNIANPSGDLTIGSADRDVYIGDGINNVDIIFEQSGEIRALTGKTVSIGQTDSYVKIVGPLYDATNNVGTASSVLLSTGSGIKWESIVTAALQGLQGTQGTQGLQGLQGTQGTQGTQGLQGLQGRQGTQGTQGLQGLQGLQGGSSAPSSSDGTAFNTGISSAVFTRLTAIGGDVLALPSTAGREYIIYSINASNIAIGNTEVNVIGAFDINSTSERSYFAYNIPIPTGTAIELLKQPQILNPSDKIVMRSTDYNRAGIDTGVEVYVTYQEVVSTDYFGVGLGTVSIATTSPTTAYTATSPSIVQSIRLTNRTDTGAYPVSVSITSGVTTTYLIDNLIVPKYGSVEILETPKRLNLNSVLNVQVDQTQTIDVQISGKVIV